MGAKRGFTLAEMLAVVGIMLVLMVAAFGVLTAFAERVGPETAVSTLQAMLNGARDYAAANGVVAAVRFTADPATKPQEGTTMRLCYKPVGVTTNSSSAWIDVRGRSAVSLGENLYACKDLPDSLPALLTVGANVSDALDESQVANWKANYEAQLTGPTGAITKVATNLGTSPFYAVFDPSGGLQTQDPAGGSDVRVQSGLTIVLMIKTSTVTKVSGFALYPLNPMSGTRLVFD
jgi:prepilin-type N-terminal cleavage/methylation domain-containing protein